MQGSCERQPHQADRAYQPATMNFVFSLFLSLFSDASLKARGMVGDPHHLPLPPSLPAAIHPPPPASPRGPPTNFCTVPQHTLMLLKISNGHIAAPYAETDSQDRQGRARAVPVGGRSYTLPGWGTPGATSTCLCCAPVLSTLRTLASRMRWRAGGGDVHCAPPRAAITGVAAQPVGSSPTPAGTTGVSKAQLRPAAGGGTCGG